LDDSEKTQPFDKVFSSEFAKNCFKGMTEAGSRVTDSSYFDRRGGVRVLLQVRSLK
jgi:hypothetical protein